ncbi:MAG: hypothetical protein Q8O35_01445 [Humidesulfovibrio sp.]|jgi:hypothetical protein|uniref:hypothetical protein n=1 Tax=Humidesulfovibrio sp. TaxID=2910988 RepID=UPI00273399E4|nr:hypothetical protein [Humidesulfovibrio sp.]MDP2846837.1 hypothetical protein [Humidesulfovibrio sp.]
MQTSTFVETEFVLLLLFSFILPGAIYCYLSRKESISRLTVLFFAMLLVIIAGLDVALLSRLREMAQVSVSTFDDRLFIGELRIALYLLPVVFAGTGVNLISHVLIHHLTQAEHKFDRRRP